MAKQKDPNHMDVWEKLVGRANEETIFINGQPVTALLDTGSQVTHVSHDYCVANGIDINPIAKLVNTEGTGGDSIEYVGYPYPSPWGLTHLTLMLYCWYYPPLSI